MPAEDNCECVATKNYDKSEDHNDEISPELEDTINRIAKKKGYTNYKLDIKNLTPDGNNFLGLLTQVTVQSVGKEDLHLFVKSTLPSAKELTMISLTEVYNVEIFAYLELSKKLDKLQADAHIPIDERYKFVRCYSESNTEHIIMENMIKKGYTVWNRFDIISLQFAEMGVKLLAKFHALGFVLQEREPKYFEEKITTLKYAIQFEGEFGTFYRKMANSVLDYIDDATKKSKLEKEIEPLLERVHDSFKNPESTTTLCHGDYRANNILVNISEGDIKDMIPVDYQIIYHGGPIIDLLYFIFGATDRDFRRKHLDYLKNLYYDTMKQFLKYFDIDVQKYYPKEEYERIFKERLEYGLFVSLYYIPFNLAKGDDIADFSKQQLSDLTIAKSDLAEPLLRDIVDEFIDWGYL